MKIRRKPLQQRYPDFVCMRTLMPTKEHGKLLAHQEKLADKGDKMSLQDLMVKITREWIKREGL